MLQETNIPTALVQKVLNEQPIYHRFFSPDFAPLQTLQKLPNGTIFEELCRYRGMIFGLADYVLFQSVRLGNEQGDAVEWKAVPHITLKRNQPHLLKLGWQFLDEDNDWVEVRSGLELKHWRYALNWLHDNHYLETREGEVSPTPKLIAAFAHTLGIRS